MGTQRGWSGVMDTNLAQLVCIACGKHDLIGGLAGDVHDALLVDDRQDAPDVPDVALARHHRLSAVLNSELRPDTCNPAYCMLPKAD